MKPYLYSFFLHLVLVLLVVSGLLMWKKAEPEKISFISTTLVTLPKTIATQSAKALPAKVEQLQTPPEKKPDEPKPEPKKIEDAKAIVKKIESKKPEDKKIEDKKPANEKPAKTDTKEAPKKMFKPSINPRELKALMDEENAELKQLEQQVSSNSVEIEQQVVMGQYSALIKRKVELYWSRPLSARNNMQVTLHIRMLPGGVVKEVTVEESSGNAAFDQSAIHAVEQAKTLPVPADSRLFNLYFKSLTLIFRPEDL